MKTKKLTFLESLATVAGAGIGTGILTLPYAINKIGISGTLIALVVAFVISLFTYYIIADLTINSKNSTQLLGILQEHVFKGKYKKLRASGAGSGNRLGAHRWRRHCDRQRT